MFNKFYKKIVDYFGKNNIVHVTFKSSRDEVLSCVGVLMNEDVKIIRIAFNAKDNQVVDFLEIPRDNITKIVRVDKKDITFYK